MARNLPRIAQNQWKKKRELQTAMLGGYLRGAKRAAEVARDMVASGWTDVDNFEKEVLRRIRSRKK
jgi:hypothetical protein